MKKSKKILIALIFILMFFIISNTSKCMASGELYLNDLEFNVKINKDGSMDVEEIWDIDIEETNTLFKTFKTDSTRYTGITNVQVSEVTTGTIQQFTQINQLMYHVTKNCYYGMKNSNGNFEIAWGVGLDDSSATKKYKISYKVQDAIAKYNDYAELYWQFVGEDFEIDAKKIKGTIILPENVNSKDEIKVWGHTEDLNGEIYATNLNKVDFEVNNFRSGRFVEVRTLFPSSIITTSGRTKSKDILNEVIEEETKWADEANARREMKNRIANIFAILGFLITIFFIIKIFKNISQLRKMEKKFKPTTKLEYFRELPYEDATPAEALFVLTSGMSKSFSESFAANILDLCLNKYITLELLEKEKFTKSGIVKITLENKEMSDLKEDERLTLEFLKEVAGEKNELTTKDITKYLEKHTSKVEKLNKKLEKILETKESENGNYLKENYENMNKYGGICGMYVVFAVIAMIIGIACAEISYKILGVAIALMLTLIINGIIFGIMAAKVNVFSQRGVDEKEKWKAFKKYMEDFSLLKDKEVPALILWEKYLVFATAFGISEKVLKQLKVIYPEIADMNSAMYTYSYIHIMNSVNIGNCINSSVYSAIGSSGNGSGGGFSGGGGGGRRPEVAVEVDNLCI